MILGCRSRVSKMRLHKLHSLRNKSVTVLPARSTWLNKRTPEIKHLRLGYFPLLHRTVALLFGSPFVAGHHEAIVSWLRLH